MPKTFTIKAGSKALQHIQSNGLQPKDISTIVGAAGGPKWIVLYGLDKYLINNWFDNVDQELHLVGSSAGAWRMLCYALENPMVAMDHFLESYIEQSYVQQPTQTEVTEKLKEIIRNSHILLTI